MIPIAGHCGIPNTAQAVSANMAVTNTTGLGFLSVWPEGAVQPSPMVASLNYSQGQTIANAVIAPLGGRTGRIGAASAGPSLPLPPLFPVLEELLQPGEEYGSLAIRRRACGGWCRLPRR